MLTRGIQRIESREGITLIELLIVVVIVAILAAIAIPSYTNYLVRARRADAKTALEQVRAAQEMWRAEKGCYARDGVDCQGNASAGTAVAKLQTTMGAPQTTISNYYSWDFTVKTGTAFTARATPAGSQATDGWLEINQDGTKRDQAGLVYPAPDCKWTK
jgi:type IV pilus assembly protein PilE